MKKWRKYPEKQPPCAMNASTHRSDLCWITVEFTDGTRKGQRVTSIASLINIDTPGYQSLWKYWGEDRTVDHWGSGRKVIAWKPFDVPEPYDL